MQVGSLVECLKTFSESDDLPQIPIRGIIYTIRSMIKEGDDIGLYLEEVVNPLMMHKEGFLEACFDATQFREIQPPVSIDIELLASEPQIV